MSNTKSLATDRPCATSSTVTGRARRKGVHHGVSHSVGTRQFVACLCPSSCYSSGSVVTAAGLVFAFTMTSFVYSDLRALGQIGTTIALGLLFDTLIVRSFMTPSIAALLGRWFWWPVRVRPRPA
jgi:MMPL family protein